MNVTKDKQKEILVSNIGLSKNPKSIKESEKVFFSKNQKILRRKFFVEKIQSSKFCQLRKLVFDQSSPVHPVSESRRGSTERHGQTEEEDGNPCVY